MVKPHPMGKSLLALDGLKHPEQWEMRITGTTSSLSSPAIELSPVTADLPGSEGDCGEKSGFWNMKRRFYAGYERAIDRFI